MRYTANAVASGTRTVFDYLIKNLYTLNPFLATFNQSAQHFIKPIQDVHIRLEPKAD